MVVPLLGIKFWIVYLSLWLLADSSVISSPSTGFRRSGPGCGIVVPRRTVPVFVQTVLKADSLLYNFFVN